MRTLIPLILILLATHLKAQTLKAVNDTIELVPGLPVTINLLANDTIPAGDSIKITGGVNFTRSLVLNTWKYKGWFTYVANQWGFEGTVISQYIVTDVTTQKSTTAKIIGHIRDKSYDSLAVNNIDAWFNASGMNFCLPFANPGGGNGFNIPAGSIHKLIYSNSLWIGGQDQDNNYYFAGERYRTGSSGSPGTHPDYYAGPVMDSVNYSAYQDTLWNYIWKIKKSEIEYHKLHWQDAGYQPIINILRWPGNGNINIGQGAQLAPFYDRNQDGIYNPMDGDYPLIRGDQALYFIFNDNRGPHLESGGQRTLKAEIHAMAYGWDMPGDSAFNNTLFLNYRIFNRSQKTYFNTSLGIFSDIDIGFYNDDFVGCDVSRGSYFGYNGLAVDGTGQSYAYGAHPPAQSVTVLAGPKMDPTGVDRSKTDGSGHPLCNESINGVGFGDGIADNERIGLSSFTWFQGYDAIYPYMYMPSKFVDYWNYLHTQWIDNAGLAYGGFGHTGYGSSGPLCRFMLPGESDTLNWGTGCVPPNGQKNWTALTAGFKPHDISGLGCVGPFTFRPNEMKELDLAFVFARDYTSPDTLASVTKLMQMIDTIRHAFVTNKLPGGGSFTGIHEMEVSRQPSLNLYPNPASDAVHIDINLPLEVPSLLMLYNDQGSLMYLRKLAKGTTKTLLDVLDFPQGLYLVVVQYQGFRMSGKLSVVR